jgi:outer membrane protein OmpA-like peptidoglycan-associated protein
MAMAMALVGFAAVATGCGGSDPAPAATGSVTTTTADPSDIARSAVDAAMPGDETTTTSQAEPEGEDGTDTTALAVGQTEGLDDLDQNGTPDPTCGTQDYGAGLVLRLPCEDMGLGNEVSEGVTLLPNSLFAFPAGNYDLVTEVSSSVIQARDVDGGKVIVFFLNSDTLFDVGQSALGDPAQVTLRGLAERIGTTFPGAAVEVRGHTDSTGDPASNQALSDQRAANVSAFLGTNGVDASRIRATGLGQNAPLAVETNADGSPNEPGRHENRRVEIVVHPV